MHVKSIYLERTSCRICGVNSDTTEDSSLESLIDFGEMALTGVFLNNGHEVTKAPMELCRCRNCGLTQLRHSYELDSLYGEWYGYESHLNPSMVRHLQSKATTLESLYGQGKPNPIYVDIASNDGTLLSGYTTGDAQLIGIDPLINVVSDHYPSKARKIVDFFSAERYLDEVGKKAQIVTSLSVLYDLESPIEFASNVSEILEEGGIWHFEQSYLPSMVNTNSYDTICHEHLLYLNLHDIKTLVESAGLQIIDATLNDVNGGSIAVTAIKTSKKINYPPFVEFLLIKENNEGYINGIKLHEFAREVEIHRHELKNLIDNLMIDGKTIMGLGASTKGNVILQSLKLDNEIIQAIGDVNPRKFGKETPGSNIKIVNESEIYESANENSIIVVLPWHFRTGMIAKSHDVLAKGAKLLFPLPRIEIYG